MHSQQLIQLPEIYSQPIVTNHQHFQQSFRPHSIQRRQLTQNLQQVFLQLGEGIPMQCGICCQFVNSRLFEYFCCSSHQFCKTCVLAVLHENLNNFTISKCPEADCLAEFNQNSPFYGQLTAFHKKKFTKIRNNRQALSKPNIKLCRNEQCDGLVSTEKLQCSFCLQKHCQICFQIQHNGKCDKQIKSGLNRKYKFNRCPNCRMMVEKSNGCAHISCICGCQFCYFCGDVFSSSHACKDKLKGGMLSKVRSYVGNQNDEINKVINCSRILEFFEPDIDRSAPLRYLELVLAFALYPFVNGICLTLAIAAAVSYLLVAASIGILFFVFLDLLEVVNLQLAPSRYLQQKGLPNWLIRILVIPMFPLNLFFGIKSKCNYVFGNTSDFDKVKVILKPMLFSLLLPCLLVEERQDSQFQ